MLKEKRVLKARKRIALIAHDNRKQDLLEWLTKNKRKLQEFIFYATGTTGTMVEKNIGLKVKKVISGPLGGDQEIGSLIAKNSLDLVIFFWDPLSAQPHDPDVKALIRLAVVWNVPIACNRATADFIANSSLMRKEYKREIPLVVKEYLNERKKISRSS